MDLKIDTSMTDVSEAELKKIHSLAFKARNRLLDGKYDFAGWACLPENYDKDELLDIIRTGEEIKSRCDVLVVIGIGGSYIGTRAILEALPAKDGSPKIYFAGNNISGTYHKALIKEIAGKEICLCVISKSGTTVETNIAFSVLKEVLIDKYGKEEASNRIYAITDAAEGVLREEVLEEGYKSFVIPRDIGGRYSVLTAVGLLPLAAAGIDARALLKGAQASMNSLKWEEDAVNYACSRFALMKQGKNIEVIEYYEPNLHYFIEWLKQLYGESEGKNGKGLYPASLELSEDLHSMGQFLQEGSQVFFETVLNIENPDGDIKVPKSADALLAGRSMNEINKVTMHSVITAHRKVGIPIIKIDIPELSEYYLGQMIYFFQMTSAITGIMMGVNPFDQPGVESYKAEMRKALLDI